MGTKSTILASHQLTQFEISFSTFWLANHNKCWTLVLNSTRFVPFVSMWPNWITNLTSLSHIWPHPPYPPDCGYRANNVRNVAPTHATPVVYEITKDGSHMPEIQMHLEEGDQAYTLVPSDDLNHVSKKNCQKLAAKNCLFSKKLPLAIILWKKKLAIILWK